MSKSKLQEQHLNCDIIQKGINLHLKLYHENILRLHYIQSDKNCFNLVNMDLI